MKTRLALGLTSLLLFLIGIMLSVGPSLVLSQAPPAAPTNLRASTPSVILRSLTVSKAGSGSGTVTGNGIACGTDCSHNYADDTQVTLTASPAGDSTFAGWSGACSGTGSCVLTMSANLVVTPTFNVTVAGGCVGDGVNCPTAFVDTDTIPTVNGTTFTVNAGGNIQTAINSAAASDGNLTHEVVIQAGATFSTNLTLPTKSGPNPSGTGWILVRTSNLAGIAAQKKRVIQATHAAAMPKIQVSASPSGVETAWRAHHYRFIGIEFIRVGGDSTGALLRIWSDPSLGTPVVTDIPTNIIVDRCILRDTVTTRKVIALHTGAGNAVIDSVVINSLPNDGDANALWMFNGPGPVKILNNLLWGNGETVFHGSAQYVGTFRPENIEFRRNLVRANAAGNPAIGKNTIEWKGLTRGWYQGNIFEDDTNTGQAVSVVMTPQPSEVSTPSVNFIEDLIFEYNYLRRVKTVFRVSGQGLSPAPPPPNTSRVMIRHNYIESMTSGDRRAFTYDNAAEGVESNHNTNRESATEFSIAFLGGSPQTNWVFRNNIAVRDIRNLFGGQETGTAALNISTSARVFSKNVLVGTTASYTGTDLTQNFFPASVSLNADGSLPAGSPYENQATDGTNIGADFTTLYGTAKGIGRFGSGANDFYAYDGQWP